MAEDIAKDYYKKVSNSLSDIEKEDEFFNRFIMQLNSGKNSLYQKHLSETRVFNGDWVESVSQSLRHIDNIIRDPKSFIAQNSEIVPIERAKKTNSESLRHLSSHSQFVREYNPRNSKVIPSKILTVFSEEDIAIYENRFIKTLIDKLTLFIEKRYELIVELIGTDYLNRLQTKNKFKYEDIQIDFEINMTLKRQIRDSELEKKNFDLLNKIEELRRRVLAFRRSDFMKRLSQARPVTSPIQKTNIINKHPDYRKCYDLWAFLDSYYKLDYTVDIYDHDMKFEEDYIDSINKLVALSFATVVSKDNSGLGEVKTRSRIFKKENVTKIISTLKPEIERIGATEVDVENNSLNEYLFQESLKATEKRIEEEVNEGEVFHVSAVEAYKDSNKITEAIFEDILKMPEEIKNNQVQSLRHRMRTQSAIDQIIKYKEKELNMMKKKQEQEKKKLEAEKKKFEEEQARRRLIEKYMNMGLSEEEIAEKMLSPEERQRRKEKERLRRQREKERLERIEKRKRDLEKAKELELKRKEQERLAKIKEKEAEKAKALKAKEAEKAKALKAKEAEKAKALKAKEKAKAMEKAKALKAKEAEKAKALKAKEAEKAKALKAKEAEKAKALKAKEAEKAKEQKAKEAEKAKAMEKAKAQKAKEKTEEAKIPENVNEQSVPLEKPTVLIENEEPKVIETLGDENIVNDNNLDLNDQTNYDNIDSNEGELTSKEEDILKKLEQKEVNLARQKRIENLKKHRNNN